MTVAETTRESLETSTPKTFPATTYNIYIQNHAQPHLKHRQRHVRI